MEITYHYAPVLKAIDELKTKGFIEDFNIEGDVIIGTSGRFGEDEFEIAHIYFYEGETDPDEKATVYGIQSKLGHKGILVTGNDAFPENASRKIIDKLLVHKKDKE
ncbi:hypothetical protein GR160_05615 [Flavobacterium sp. Sd200]|uniref:hypothetical protein n=1 Tax=Flavobacterium sp. Sd200 TaxID=2692211 RepID=UPI00136A1925|nr:hypothetical protein [Flavobacterium sp. Sd200]MXN90697.1 hypothetical protein [Flavobacterium sp. Sd200]